MSCSGSAIQKTTVSSSKKVPHSSAHARSPHQFAGSRRSAGSTSVRVSTFHLQGASDHSNTTNTLVRFIPPAHRCVAIGEARKQEAFGFFWGSERFFFPSSPVFPHTQKISLSLSLSSQPASTPSLVSSCATTSPRERLPSTALPFCLTLKSPPPPNCPSHS